MQYVQQLACSVSASLTIYRWQNAAKSVPQRVTARQSRPSLDCRNQFPNPAKSHRLEATQRFFLGAPVLVLVLPDNSGTGIRAFPPLLIPASAWAAIPRTSNLLQVGNSSAHRNVRIAFPWHYSLLSRRFYRALLPNKTFNSFCPQADAPSNLWQTQCLRGMVFVRQ